MAQPVAERLPLEQLEHQVQHVLLLAPIVNANEVRMIESGADLNFAQKTLLVSAVATKFAAQHFDGDFLAHIVAGLEDFPVAAPSQTGE